MSVHAVVKKMKNGTEMLLFSDTARSEGDLCANGNSLSMPRVVWSFLALDT